MKTVILAGGFGTCISEEPHLMPKPILAIGGYPILLYIMIEYLCFGLSGLTICGGCRGHIIKEYFCNYYLHLSSAILDFAADNKMATHNNVAEPWRVTVAHTGRNTRTRGRMRCVAKYVGSERFMTTYGDGVSAINLRELIQTHEKSGKTVTLSAIQPGGKSGVLGSNGRGAIIAGFRKKTQEDGVRVNAGFIVMNPDVFNYIGGDSTVFELTTLERLSAEGKLGVYRHKGFWQCPDTARDKGALEKERESGKAGWKVWKD